MTGVAADGNRVALYARTSTRDQHTGLQLEELRRVADQRGWHVVGEYVDEGHSGSKDRRPRLDALMATVHRGRVDIVACWKFDRFARSVRHLVLALDDFRARGVDFISLRDGIDTSTPAGRFTYHVMAAVAELERELIRERTRAGMLAAKRRGATIGRPRVYVSVVEAKRLLAQGLSYREVGERLGCGASTVHNAVKGANAGVQKGSSDQ